jgi:DcmR-like sensory protein
MHPLLEDLCQGRPGRIIHVYGEMVDVLWRRGDTRAAIQLEMLWNDLANRHDFSLLCGYAMGNFYKDAEKREICSHHTHSA